MVRGGLFHLKKSGFAFDVVNNFERPAGYGIQPICIACTDDDI